jgi:hypothetical protein
MTDYVADNKICAQCPLRAECTKSKTGRSVARHWREKVLEVALAFARLPEAKSDRRRRRSLMEGSFAHAANHDHFKRARGIQLWQQQTQDGIIAAGQNIARLCGAAGAGVAAERPKRPRQGAVGLPGRLFRCPLARMARTSPRLRIFSIFAPPRATRNQTSRTDLRHRNEITL